MPTQYTQEEENFIVQRFMLLEDNMDERYKAHVGMGQIIDGKWVNDEDETNSDESEDEEDNEYFECIDKIVKDTDDVDTKEDEGYDYMSMSNVDIKGFCEKNTCYFCRKKNDGVCIECSKIWIYDEYSKYYNHIEWLNSTGDVAPYSVE